MIQTTLRTDTGLVSQRWVGGPGNALIINDGDTILVVDGHTGYSAANVTQVIQPYDVWAECSNAATTGVTMPTAYGPGQQIKVTNSTGADFIGGDFAIPNGSTWTLGWNGTSWLVLGIS